MKGLYFSGSASNDTHVLPYWITVNGDNCNHVLGKMHDNDKLFHVVKTKSGHEIIASGSIEELVALGYGLSLSEHSFEVEYTFMELDENAKPRYFAPDVVINGEKIKMPTNGLYWFLDKQVRDIKPISVIDNVVTYKFNAKCHLKSKGNTLLCEY